MSGQAITKVTWCDGGSVVYTSTHLAWVPVSAGRLTLEEAQALGRAGVTTHYREKRSLRLRWQKH